MKLQCEVHWSKTKKLNEELLHTYVGIHTQHKDNCNICCCNKGAASSFLPISVPTLSSVCPWLLCIRMVYLSCRGSWCCGRQQPLDSHSNVSGEIGTAAIDLNPGNVCAHNIVPCIRRLAVSWFVLEQLIFATSATSFATELDWCCRNVQIVTGVMGACVGHHGTVHVVAGDKFDESCRGRVKGMLTRVVGAAWRV